MRFRKSRAVKELTAESGWDLPTSMIDVVFLLLIFFMCASKFRVLEQRLDAFLPKGGREWVDPPPPPPKDVDLIIKVSTLKSASRRPHFQIRSWATHDPNELAALLMRLPRPGKYRVVIDGDGNCPFQHLMSALDACARARLTDVAFRPPEVAKG